MTQADTGKPSDPVRDALDALERCLSAGTLLTAHYEASQAIAALRRLEYHDARDEPSSSWGMSIIIYRVLRDEEL